MKVGDPVIRYHKYHRPEHRHLSHWSNAVYFIKAMGKEQAQIAQEEWPMSHFSYVYLSELKPAQFTKKAHKDMRKYREQAITQAEKE